MYSLGQNGEEDEVIREILCITHQKNERKTIGSPLSPTDLEPVFTEDLVI